MRPTLNFDNKMFYFYFFIYNIFCLDHWPESTLALSTLLVLDTSVAGFQSCPVHSARKVHAASTHSHYRRNAMYTRHGITLAWGRGVHG